MLYPAARIASEAEPPTYHYATLKEQAGAPAAELEIGAPRSDENELYAQWRDAPDMEKPRFEKPLFDRLLHHARAVIWLKTYERDPEWENLASDIASAAIKNLSLERFKEGSKFSTYVEGIARNKINEELERRITKRETTYVSANPEDDITLKDDKAEAAFDKVEKDADLERLVKELRGKDYVLLQCKLDGMTTAEAAERLGDSEDAAESRWRRLVAHLIEKIQENPNGK